MSTPKIEFKAIPVNDPATRRWARPYLIRFGNQFGIDTNRIEPRNRYIYKESNDPEPSPDHWLDEGHRYWFILIDNEPAGYIIVNPESTYFKNTMHIRELFIAPKHRGNGYGTALMQFAIAETKQINPTLTMCSLNVLERNDAAKKVYRKVGFETFTSTMLKRI